MDFNTHNRIRHCSTDKTIHVTITTILSNDELATTNRTIHLLSHKTNITGTNLHIETLYGLISCHISFSSNIDVIISTCTLIYKSLFL